MYIYLIDTRDRFCELGAWLPTETKYGDLILRRIMSLGSLWDVLRHTPGPEKEMHFYDAPMGYIDDGFHHSYGEFVYVDVDPLGFSTKTFKCCTFVEKENVGDLTVRKAVEVHIYKRLGRFKLPKCQPVQEKCPCGAALSVIKNRQKQGLFIARGDVGEFEYAEFIPIERRQPSLKFAKDDSPYGDMFCTKTTDYTLVAVQPQSVVTLKKDPDIYVLEDGTSVFVPDGHVLPRVG